MSDRQHFWRGTSTGFLVLSVGYLPVMLVGVLAVQLEDDLGLTPTQLGWAIAAYWTVNASVAPVAGHHADRRGWAPITLAGVSLAGVTTALLGLVTTSGASLIILMAVAGLGMSLCSQPSNLVIAREVPWRLQGRAFGVKQTSPPVMALLAGLIVATVAVNVGWRWSFAVATLLTVPTLGLVIPYVMTHRRVGNSHRIPAGMPDLSHETTPPPMAITLISAGVACASVAIAALGAFSVPTLVSSGISVATAALLFSLASAVAIASRLVTGWFTDRRGPTSLALTASMVGVSTVGLLLLALHAPLPVVVGLVIALTLGWGWSTALIPVVMRFWRRSSARTTGFISIGTSAGSSAGPVLFGVVVTAVGYSLAWVLTAVLSLCAVALLLSAQRLMAIHGPRTPRP